ncbi:hypothetical protein [Winogradskyella sediminis]|uniref:hypothetical protein n=1 Tax=Winogradskyella sediminis TaxID=1382466 RepID=UPI003AA8925E
MKKIKVYDAIMGSGKTYNAIERMKNYLNEGKKFIYITPFKTEIERVLEALGNKEVYAPVGIEDSEPGGFEIENDFIEDDGTLDLNKKPSYKILNKRTQFLKMVSQEKNIISTHSLFMNLKREDFSLFTDYILILDEVVTPLKIEKIGAIDIQILKNEDLVVINQETNEVKFICDDYNDPAFKHVKKLCDNSSVYYLDKYFFVWIFPIEIFKQFKEIQILTYLFDGSFLAAYFKMYNIDFELLKEKSKKHLLEFKKLLNIYEGRSNNIIGKNTFSKTWIENLSNRNAKKIEDATSNIFKRVFNTRANENAFTTFKSSRDKLSGGGYTKGFIPINSRASNEYSNKKSMAYLGNRYFKPQYVSFFREKGISLNEDLWALSELIQWVWRGCIREGEEMNIFIPSERMRALLNDWLDGKFNLETE